MTMTCDKLDILLPEFFDGSLDKNQEAAAAEHLATCDQCRLQVTEFEGVGELYRRHGRLTLPANARERIRQALGVDTASTTGTERTASLNTGRRDAPPGDVS